MAAVVELGHTVGELLSDTSDGQSDERLAATGTIQAEALRPAETTQLVAIARRHIVAVDAAAPSCCIDGRPCLHTLAGMKTTPRPSLAGGALMTAYAAYELLGWPDKLGSGDTPAGRLAALASRLRSGGIIPGTHIDETSERAMQAANGSQPPATGCGADDRYPHIITKPYRNTVAVQKLVRPLMGESYLPWLSFASEAAVTEAAAAWRPTDITDVIADATAIEVLASPAGMANHGHRESFVTFNYKPNCTLDRDSFSQETDRQMFVVDVWYIDKVAQALTDNGDDTSQAYSAMFQAMVTYQVATYLTLCDSSQRCLFVK